MIGIKKHVVEVKSTAKITQSQLCLLRLAKLIYIKPLGCFSLLPSLLNQWKFCSFSNFFE